MQLQNRWGCLQGYIWWKVDLREEIENEVIKLKILSPRYKKPFHLGSPTRCDKAGDTALQIPGKSGKIQDTQQMKPIATGLGESQNNTELKNDTLQEYFNIIIKFNINHRLGLCSLEVTNILKQTVEPIPPIYYDNENLQTVF